MSDSLKLLIHPLNPPKKIVTSPNPFVSFGTVLTTGFVSILMNMLTLIWLEPWIFEIPFILFLGGLVAIFSYLIVFLIISTISYLIAKSFNGKADYRIHLLALGYTWFFRILVVLAILIVNLIIPTFIILIIFITVLLKTVFFIPASSVCRYVNNIKWKPALISVILPDLILFFGGIWLSIL